MAGFRDRIRELRRVRAGDLMPNTANWRRHPKAQVDAVRGVLSEIGYADALLARETPDGLMLIDGHLRQSLDAEQIVPVLVLDVTEQEARTIMATLDPLAGMADADAAAFDDLLRQVSVSDAALREMLADMAADMGLGYGAGAGGDAPEDPGAGGDAPEDPGADHDRAEELRQKWGTERGQLWGIGRHRLLCGDSTDGADVARLLGGVQPATLVFDPPWDADAPAPAGPFAATLVFTDGRRTGDAVRLFGAPAWVFVWDCVSCWYTPNRPLQRTKLCLWYGDVASYQFDGAHYGEPLEAKTVHNSRGEYAYVPDARGKHLADLYAEPITRLHADGLHPHEKPSTWVRLLLANCTSGAVYDPYAGAGTTLVAAEQVGRPCYGVELAPEYVAVALERLAGMGLEPRLVPDG